MQPTREAILAQIRNHGHATIRSLAESLGLAIPTVRHHVMVLEKDGMVVGSEVRDGVGRPYLRYRLSEIGHESSPKKYDWLSNALISAIKTELGEAGLKKLFQSISARTMERYSPDVEGKTFQERAEIIEEILQAEGYVTQWGEDDGVPQLTLLTCPFHHVAVEHLEVCRLDGEIIEQVMGIPIRQVACIVQGDPTCKFNLQPEP